MTNSDLPDRKQDKETQSNQVRPAPKLRRAHVHASEQNHYPDKLQYTGKNLRVDYLNSEDASVVKKRTTPIRKINSDQLADPPKNNKTESKQPETPPRAEKAMFQDDSATAKTKAADIAKARAQAQLSKQTSGRIANDEAYVNDKKRRNVLAITASVLIVAVVLIFALSAMLKNPAPTEPGNETIAPTEPAKLEAWTEAELQTAKLALSEEVIFPGIHIAGVDMSGLSAEEANQALSLEVEKLLSEIDITVRANDESFTLDADDIGYTFDSFSALEKAWSIGRSSEHYDDDLDLILRYQVISAIEEETLDIDLDGYFDEDILKNSLQKKLSDILPVFSEAKAIGFDTTTLRFQVEEGTVGLEADISAAIKDLHQILREEDFKGEVVLQLEEKQPNITAAMIHNNTGFVAEASTPIYGSWQLDRNYNLIVAAEKMTGDVVQPGETYSYMVSLGPITTQAGFMSGSAIVGGTYVDVIGGGLCQPSTTLFQAVAKADLEIVERHNHGMRSSYYEYGQDAMIYGGSFDFKFRNNTDYPLAIVAETSGNYLVYRIYGQPLPEGVTIGLTSIKTGDLEPIETTKHVENTELAPGESKQTLAPIVGSTWETYKVYYKNGVEFDRQYLTYSRYPSVARRIEHGASLPPTERVPETLPSETQTTVPPETTAPSVTEAPTTTAPVPAG
ncbi:MAG: VanW family protein [Eubacteriales bacterium]|nr:VanW family protein [Eubacteriales bacterium]